MSLGSRNTLGIVFVFGAVCWAIIGAYLGPQLPVGPTPFYGLSAFCIVVTLACFSRGSHVVTLRIIGAVIFGSYVWYALNNFGNPRFAQALKGFMAFGLPAGYVLILGRYPVWGSWSAAFKSSDDSDSESAQLDHGC